MANLSNEDCLAFIEKHYPGISAVISSRGDAIVNFSDENSGLQIVGIQTNSNTSLANSAGYKDVVNGANVSKFGNYMKTVAPIKYRAGTNAYCGNINTTSIRSNPKYRSDSFQQLSWPDYASLGSITLPASEVEKTDKWSNIYSIYFKDGAESSATYRKSVLDLVTPFANSLGYEVDTELPLIVRYKNFNPNAQTINEPNTRSSELPDIPWIGGALLPGKKILSIYIRKTAEINADVGYSGYAVFVYVNDDGSNICPAIVCSNTMAANNKVGLWSNYDLRYMPDSFFGSWTPDYVNTIGFYEKSDYLNSLFGGRLVSEEGTVNTNGLNAGQSAALTYKYQTAIGQLADFSIQMLFGIPGNFDFLIRGKFDQEINKIKSGDNAFAFVNVVSDAAKSEFFASMSVDWYETYRSTGFGIFPISDVDNVKKAIGDWKTNGSFDIRYFSSQQTLSLTEVEVKTLPMAIKYANVRRKACKEDNFMDLMYDDVNTYSGCVKKWSDGRALVQLTTDSVAPSIPVDSGLTQLFLIDGNVYTDSNKTTLATKEDYYKFIIQGNPRNADFESKLSIDANSADFKNVLAQQNGYSAYNGDSIRSYSGDGSADYTTNRYVQSVAGYPYYPGLNGTQKIYLKLTNASQYLSLVSTFGKIIRTFNASYVTNYGK